MDARSIPDTLNRRSWIRFGHDAGLAAWVDKALPFARATVRAKGNEAWWRCGDTWFVGVNALPNDDSGAVGDSGPIAGKFLDFMSAAGMAPVNWDRAQVSVCYPGYPRPMPSESPAAFRYRMERDAAHVDGLLRRPQDRRRIAGEQHAFILGIPLTAAAPGASPFVVWEGSHHIIREHLGKRLHGIDHRRWQHEDITDALHQARNEVFERCKRVEIHALPGECYLLHRLTLHGIAPWRDGARAGPDGRMICYFRPPMKNPENWLQAE